MSNLRRTIEAELAATGLPWRIQPGTRHAKIFLAGKLTGILPRGPRTDGSPRATRNTIAQIRRRAREAKQ